MFTCTGKNMSVFSVLVMWALTRTKMCMRTDTDTMLNAFKIHECIRWAYKERANQRQQNSRKTKQRLAQKESMEWKNCIYF